jgi:hypothetical protein
MARESHAMFRCHPVRYALVIIFLSTAVAVICTLSIRYVHSRVLWLQL